MTDIRIEAYVPSLMPGLLKVASDVSVNGSLWQSLVESTAVNTICKTPFVVSKQDTLKAIATDGQGVMEEPLSSPVHLVPTAHSDRLS